MGKIIVTVCFALVIFSFSSVVGICFAGHSPEYDWEVEQDDKYEQYYADEDEGYSVRQTQSAGDIIFRVLIVTALFPIVAGGYHGMYTSELVANLISGVKDFIDTIFSSGKPLLIKIILGVYGYVVLAISLLPVLLIDPLDSITLIPMVGVYSLFFPFAIYIVAFVIASPYLLITEILIPFIKKIRSGQITRSELKSKIAGNFRGLLAIVFCLGVIIGFIVLATHLDEIFDFVKGLFG